MARSRMIDAALGALACALTGSCVDDSVSIRIDCVIPPSADCSYAASGELCFSDGLVNLAVANDYYVGLRVVNSLRARARTSPPLAEPNGVTVQGFDVHVHEPSGASYDFGALPNPFFVTSAGWASPGDGAAAIGATVLPTDYLAVLAANEARTRTKVGAVLVDISVRGRTDGNRTVESDTITVPVQLVLSSADYAVGECVVLEGTICNPGQDQYARACDPSTVPE